MRNLTEKSDVNGGVLNMPLIPRGYEIDVYATRNDILTASGFLKKNTGLLIAKYCGSDVRVDVIAMPGANGM